MVREIRLTRGHVALVDDEDYGYLSQFKWNVVARGSTFHAFRRTPKPHSRTIYMHREILLISEPLITDHVDLNGLNNTRANLRPATKAQNNRNVGLLKNNRSGFKGVSWETWSGRWKATIAANGKKVSLGRFQCPEAAARAYDERARVLFGEFARLNFPLPGERAVSTSPPRHPLIHSIPPRKVAS